MTTRSAIFALGTTPRSVLFALTFAHLGACSPDINSPGATATPGGDQCQKDQTRCVGNAVQTCDNNFTYQPTTACDASQACDNTLGCVACAPGGNTCVNQEIHACSDQGTVAALVSTCDFGQKCVQGACVDACEVKASELVYLVDEQNNFISFAPRNDTDPSSLTVINKLNCPAKTGATPFSMGVDRKARAWVLYNSGEIFLVSTQDASCQKTAFTPNQMGFNLFGMGFVSDQAGGRSETLYIGGGTAGGSGTGASLGRIDTTGLLVSPIAAFPTSQYSPEMTGTGAAELFGYFPGTTMVDHKIARLNRATAQYDQVWQLAPLDSNPGAWAFAHWGGRYYQFVTTTSGNHIYRFDPATQTNVLVQDKTLYKVVGAGVSTCAPYIVG